MSDASISLTINGRAQEVPPGLTVEGLLAHLGRDPGAPGVAVAVGDRVVRRAEWAETRLAAGDHVEVVTAAQGG